MKSTPLNTDKAAIPIASTAMVTDGRLATVSLVESPETAALRIDVELAKVLVMRTPLHHSLRNAAVAKFLTEACVIEGITRKDTGFHETFDTVLTGRSQSIPLHRLYTEFLRCGGKPASDLYAFLDESVAPAFGYSNFLAFARSELRDRSTNRFFSVETLEQIHNASGRPRTQDPLAAMILSNGRELDKFVRTVFEAYSVIVTHGEWMGNWGHCGEASNFTSHLINETYAEEGVRCTQTDCSAVGFGDSILADSGYSSREKFATATMRALDDLSDLVTRWGFPATYKPGDLCGMGRASVGTEGKTVPLSYIKWSIEMIRSGFLTFAEAEPRIWGGCGDEGGLKIQHASFEIAQKILVDPRFDALTNVWARVSCGNMISDGLHVVNLVRSEGRTWVVDMTSPQLRPGEGAVCFELTTPESAFAHGYVLGTRGVEKYYPDLPYYEPKARTLAFVAGIQASP